MSRSVKDGYARTCKLINNDELSLHGGSRCCDALTTAGGHIDRCVGLKCVRLMRIFCVLVPSGIFAEFRTAAHSVNCSDA